MCWQNKAKILEKLNYEPAVALKKERFYIVFIKLFAEGNNWTSDWVY